jgi:hypothetical protein
MERIGARRHDVVARLETPVVNELMARREAKLNNASFRHPTLRRLPSFAPLTGPPVSSLLR